MSVKSQCMKVFVQKSILLCPCAEVQKRTPLISSSSSTLLILFILLWCFCDIGGKWLYSCYSVVYCIKDFFSIYRVAFLQLFLSIVSLILDGASTQLYEYNQNFYLSVSLSLPIYIYIHVCMCVCVCVCICVCAWERERERERERESVFFHFILLKSFLLCFWLSFMKNTYYIYICFSSQSSNHAACMDFPNSLSLSLSLTHTHTHTHTLYVPIIHCSRSVFSTTSFVCTELL